MHLACCDTGEGHRCALRREKVVGILFSTFRRRSPRHPDAIIQQWWHNATHEVPDISPHNADVIS